MLTIFDPDFFDVNTINDDLREYAKGI